MSRWNFKSVSANGLCCLAISGIWGCSGPSPGEAMEPIATVRQGVCTGAITQNPCNTGNAYPLDPANAARSIVRYRYDPNLSATWGSESDPNSNKGKMRSAMNEWQTATNNRYSFVQTFLTDANTLVVWDSRVGQSTICSPSTHCWDFNQGAGFMRHELGHCLGLAHEHERVDRDKYVIINPSSSNCLHDGVTIFSDIWSICNALDNVNGANFGPYDFASTMHYGAAGVPADFVHRSADMPLWTGMGAPTYDDGSKAIELGARQYGWGKFFTRERDKGPTIPWDPSIASGIMMTGAPTSANLHAQNSLHAFARGSDGNIWSKGQDSPSWWEWYSLGAPPGGAPGEPAAVTTSNTTLMLVGVVNSTGVWLRSWTSGGWGNWYSIGLPPVAVGSSYRITMSSWGSARLDVFIVDSNNSIWQKTWTGSNYIEWRNLGAAADSKAAVTSWAANRIDLFTRGADNHLWHRWCDTLTACNSAAWSSWEDMGGALMPNTSPAVVSANSGWLDVFVLGAGTRIFLKRYRSSTGWEAPFYQLGGNIVGGSVAATSPSAGRIDVHAQLTDGGLWHRWTL
jgi:hypothetical protein